MTSSSTPQRKAGSRRIDTIEGPVSSPLWLWGISTLVLLGRFDGWFSEGVRLVSPPLDCLLTPAWAWNAPLSLVLDVLSIAESPVWLFAVIGGTIIATLSHRIASVFGIVGGMIAVLGFSLAFESRELISGLLILLIVGVSQWQSPGHRRQCATLMGWMVLCVLVSIDFGLLWLYAVLLILPAMLEQADPLQKRKIGAVVLLAATSIGIVAYFCSAGFINALLRPVNWLWVHTASELLPSMNFAFTVPDCWTSHFLLSCVLLMCWRRMLVTSSLQWPRIAATVLLSCLGLGCGRFMWLAAFGLATTIHGKPKSIVVTRRGQLLVAVFFVIVLVRPLNKLTDVTQAFLGSGTPARVVDPTELLTAGRVMLTNLDQSRDWQIAHYRSRFRLLLNERWDVFGPLYPTYAAVCRDIAELQSDSYLRTDGQWGGYQRWLKQWLPTLLVIDSKAVEDIRRLSLSPHWKLLSIDRDRTIFGRAEEPETQAPMRRAAATLSRLEWPGLSGAPLDANVIVVHDAAEYLQAACVLVAIRLPYAALRVLRSGPQSSDLELEALCYLELAHRAQRYGGVPSLLDQVRAVNRIRNIKHRSFVDPAVLLRIAHGLAGLGLDEIASEIAHEMSRGISAWRATVDQRTQAIALTAKLGFGGSSRHASPPLHEIDTTETELLIREELRRGDVAACRPLLEKLENSTRPYYAALASAAEESTAQSLNSLRSALEQPDLPKRLRGEALFYLGCLANEIGDPPTAATAFSQSAEVAPTSPFAPLRSLFLRQITGQ